jgi:hypothetical protein
MDIISVIRHCLQIILFSASLIVYSAFSMESTTESVSTIQSLKERLILIDDVDQVIRVYYMVLDCYNGTKFYEKYIIIKKNSQLSYK